MCLKINNNVMVAYEMRGFYNKYKELVDHYAVSSFGAFMNFPRNLGFGF